MVPAGVSGSEFQLEIAAQSSSRVFVELDWAADTEIRLNAERLAVTTVRKQMRGTSLSAVLHREFTVLILVLMGNAQKSWAGSRSGREFQ